MEQQYVVLYPPTMNFSHCQINARTELALRYNDISPLENHHSAVAFEILEKVRPGQLDKSTD